MIHKLCSCGHLHTALPPDAKHHTDPDSAELTGFYFDCACRSTLFVPDAEVRRTA